eukprot:scaffold200868_cov35-Tisochrysis_lutea.AAC.2
MGSFGCECECQRDRGRGHRSVGARPSGFPYGYLGTTRLTLRSHGGGASCPLPWAPTPLRGAVGQP